MRSPLPRRSIACSTSTCAERTRIAVCRDLLANHPRRLEPFRCVARRHPDVDDHELGLVLADELDQLGRVPALAHDLEAGTLEQARQPLAEKDVVVGHDHARRAARS